MRRLLRAALAVIAILTGTVAVNAAMPGTAGAAIVPCSGYNNGWSWVSNGWFDTIYGAVNCTRDANHIVVDLYGADASYYQGVLDIWYPPNCFPTFTGSSSNGFQVHLWNNYGGTCASTGVHGSTSLPYQYHAKQGSPTSGRLNLTTNPIYCDGSDLAYVEGWADFRRYGTNNGGPGSAYFNWLSWNYDEGGGCIRDKGHTSIKVWWS